MEFSEYLKVLTDPSAPLSAGELQHLHSLEAEERDALRAAWRRLDGERRQDVVRQLMELAEDNVELDFDAVYMLALEDEAGAVRAWAVRGLWEYEGRDLIGRLLELLEHDEEPEVRAESALALGRFVLLSETGTLSERHSERVERGLRRAVEDELETEEVRARALEAIGARDLPWVSDAIEAAYESDSRRQRVSAVHAMGRSCQARWLPALLAELESDDAEMRYEAATALGSLGDRRTASRLAPLTHDGDAEVREAAIGALGQFGGPEAKALLRQLLADPSPAVQEAAAAALAEAEFAEDPLSVEHRV
jgi:HEAT repeat protein